MELHATIELNRMLLLTDQLYPKPPFDKFESANWIYYDTFDVIRYNIQLMLDIFNNPPQSWLNTRNNREDDFKKMFVQLTNYLFVTVFSTVEAGMRDILKIPEIIKNLKSKRILKLELDKFDKLLQRSKDYKILDESNYLHFNFFRAVRNSTMHNAMIWNKIEENISGPVKINNIIHEIVAGKSIITDNIYVYLQGSSSIVACFHAWISGLEKLLSK